MNEQRWHLLNKEAKKKWIEKNLKVGNIDEKWEVVLQRYNHCYKILYYILAEIAEKKVNKIEQAQLLGAMIAEKAKAVGIETVVFDRNGYLYHGRVKALADAARNGGLNF